MKNIYLIVAFAFFINVSYSQYSVIKKSITDIGIVNNGVSSTALQPDGKIVVAGSVLEGSIYKLCILRYKANGSADSTFGINGIDTFSIQKILPAPYQGAFLRSVAIQNDGKIVVAGAAWYLSGVSYLSNVLVMRLNKNGSVDTSFGDDGTVRTNINSSTGLSVDEANAVKVQTDGKIVIAGDTYDYIQNRFLVIRYNTDGSADNGFGSGGASVLAIGTSDDKAFAMSIQKNGKIILAGESYSNNVSYTVALARYNTNGMLDTSFGNKGIRTTNISPGTDIAQAVAIQDNNQIIISGYTLNVASNQTNALCIRYNSNGNIDSNFGNNGKVIIDVHGQNDDANNVMIQNNKILLSGYATSADSISEFLSIRLLPNGTKDKTYGAEGITTTSLFKQGDAAYGMIVLNGGNILLAGQTTKGASNYISLVRYRINGSIDSVFATNGKKITGIGSSEDVAYKMIRTPWEKNSLLVAGTANGYWVVAKYNAITLLPDSSFGLNGSVSVKYKNPQDPHDKPSLAVDAQTKKIYIAGYSGSGVTIVCFDKDGIQDEKFGKKGVVNYGLSIFYGGFGIEPDHKILVAGVRQESITGYNFVARLNANGTTDSSFGTNGEVQYLPLSVNSIEMKRDGSSILLAGRVPINFDGAIGVLSLNKNGSFDNTFGTNGLVYKKAQGISAQVFFRYSMTQDQVGRILVSGGVQVSTFQFSVTRFLKNGTIDSSFANKGLFVKDVTTGDAYDNSNEGISSYCVGNNCSILTSGIKLNDFNEQSSAIVMTLKNNGTIDKLNNNTGYIDTSFFNDKYEASYAALIDTIAQSTEVMFVAGKASNGSNSDFSIIKIVKPFYSISSASIPVSKINYNIRVTPNPAHSNIAVNYTVSFTGNTEIKLTDVAGRTIIKQTQYSNKGDQQLLMQLPQSITTGVYVVTISSVYGINTYKLLVD